VSSGQKLANLEPISDAFTLHDSPIQGHYRLSRFACLRRLDRETVLESPLGHGRLFLHQGQAAALVSLLAEPQNAAKLAHSLPTAEAPDIECLINSASISTSRLRWLFFHTLASLLEIL
jgi:hypothetical protein